MGYIDMIKKKNNNYIIDKDGIKNFNINVNGYKMFHSNPISDIYYNSVTPYQYFINMLPDGVVGRSFSLYPLKSQPSGSINFSIFKGKMVTVEFTKTFMQDYYNDMKNIITKELELHFVIKNYNILSIDKGKCRHLFSK